MNLDTPFETDDRYVCSRSPSFPTLSFKRVHDVTVSGTSTILSTNYHHFARIGASNHISIWGMMHAFDSWLSVSSTKTLSTTTTCAIEALSVRDKRKHISTINWQWIEPWVTKLCLQINLPRPFFSHQNPFKLPFLLQSTENFEIWLFSQT